MHAKLGRQQCQTKEEHFFFFFGGGGGGGVAKIMRLQHHYNLSIRKFTIKDWNFDNLRLFWAMEAFRYSNPCYTSSQS